MTYCAVCCICRSAGEGDLFHLDIIRRPSSSSSSAAAAAYPQCYGRWQQVLLLRGDLDRVEPVTWPRWFPGYGRLIRRRRCGWWSTTCWCHVTITSTDRHRVGAGDVTLCRGRRISGASTAHVRLRPWRHGTFPAEVDSDTARCGRHARYRHPVWVVLGRVQRWRWRWRYHCTLHGVRWSTTRRTIRRHIATCSTYVLALLALLLLYKRRILQKLKEK